MEDQINRSNRSFVTLQIGQIPGGDGRAQRYPQTVQRQTGKGNTGLDVVLIVCMAFKVLRSDRGGRRSGIGLVVSFPEATSALT